jgi:N-acetylmuramoyl-L-alanine amidase
MREIDTIIIHCADTYASMDINAATVRKWHVEERGWDDIGYHYFIKRDGNLERGRNDDVIGAHASGHNKTSIGICMAGGKGVDGGPVVNYTAAQWAQLADLCVNLKFKYNADIIGHNDVSSKSCPNFNVINWAERLGE